MPVHERRQHFRIEDHIYFEYRAVNSESFASEQLITDELLSKCGQKYIEASNYFQNIDAELADLTQNIALKEPALAHYLNLLNAKIDFLSRQLMMSDKIQMRKVNISLGGMAFRTPEIHKENAMLKMVIYAKPRMIPIIIDAEVIYCQYRSETHYHTSVEFRNLTSEQEQLLSQHILLAQVKSRGE